MLSIPQTTIQLKYDWLRDHLGYSLEDHARNPILLTRSLTDNLGPRISYAMHRGLRGECAPMRVCLYVCVGMHRGLRGEFAPMRVCLYVRGELHQGLRGGSASTCVTVCVGGVGVVQFAAPAARE